MLSDQKDKYNKIVAGLLAVLLCVFGLFTSTALGKWYSADPDYYRCIEEAYIKGTPFADISGIDGPAVLIEMINLYQLKFTTSDVKEGGKIVETTITIPSYRKSVTFYRTKERCEKVIEPLKKKAEQEQLRREKEAAKYR